MNHRATVYGLIKHAPALRVFGKAIVVWAAKQSRKMNMQIFSIIIIFVAALRALMNMFCTNYEIKGKGFAHRKGETY